MNIHHLINKLEEIFLKLLKTIAAFSLCFLMILTTSDVVARYFFNSPINGATELTEYSLAILVGSALPIITWQDKQVAVDIFENFLNPYYLKLQAIGAGLIATLGYLVTSFKIFELAQRSSRRDSVSEYLEIPISLIQSFVGTMCFIGAIGLILFFLIPKILELVGVQNNKNNKNTKNHS